MKLWKVVVLVVIAFFAGAATLAANIIGRGISTRMPPSALEALAAGTLRDMAIPRADKELRDPWKATPEVIAAGRAHWADHCATCHGNDGSGKTETGQGLYPRTPDMRLLATQDLSDGELYYIIRNGVRLTGMPAWGDPNLKRDDESWHLVAFIRHLPQLTPAEIEEMEKLNPKTDAERQEEQQEQEFLTGGAPGAPGKK